MPTADVHIAPGIGQIANIPRGPRSADFMVASKRYPCTDANAMLAAPDEGVETCALGSLGDSLDDDDEVGVFSGFAADAVI